MVLSLLTQAERRRLRSAIVVQSFVRGALCRLHFKAEKRAQWDERKKQMAGSSTGGGHGGSVKAAELLELQRILLSFYDNSKDAQRLVRFNRLIC